ncbi:hypothetical protein K431DRAFT_34733 [Polychaeton citri CBS 116435]|uniref:Uncharacterized protein n=1 Tax=Polychaeton citri CBS 116435 TaxID=1314669 RepID=A0A9P4QC44_9PEZI|nr:hypothetical protein K431DRAFT_34733 [Polychaeton citri CBS 116435]
MQRGRAFSTHACVIIGCDGWVVDSVDIREGFRRSLSFCLPHAKISPPQSDRLTREYGPHTVCPPAAAVVEAVGSVSLLLELNLLYLGKANLPAGHGDMAPTRLTCQQQQQQQQQQWWWWAEAETESRLWEDDDRHMLDCYVKPIDRNLGRVVPGGWRRGSTLSLTFLFSIRASCLLNHPP